MASIYVASKSRIYYDRRGYNTWSSHLAVAVVVGVVEMAEAEAEAEAERRRRLPLGMERTSLQHSYMV